MDVPKVEFPWIIQSSPFVKKTMVAALREIPINLCMKIINNCILRVKKRFVEKGWAAVKFETHNNQTDPYNEWLLDGECGRCNEVSSDSLKSPL